MRTAIHTVIFDLDGTLADSVILTMAAFARVLPKFGLPIPAEQAVKTAIGYANPEFYYRLFPDFPCEVVHDAGLLVEQEELNVLPEVRSRLLFPGCLALLTRLKEANIRLNIASTGGQGHVYGILNATETLGLFDTVSCGRPDKIEMLREMAAGTDKSGYLMVGDMKKDYEAARANGILSVGACYGYCRRAHSDFDFYIHAPLELLGILH